MYCSTSTHTHTHILKSVHNGQFEWISNVKWAKQLYEKYDQSRLNFFWFLYMPAHLLAGSSP